MGTQAYALAGSADSKEVWWLIIRYNG